jgi:hypothetical protein
MRRLNVTALAVIAMTAGACQDNLDAPLDQPELDRPFFDCKVQPVLTQYCSALACHGDPGRFFRVFARNRSRLGGDEAARNAQLKPEERAHNYAAALAVVRGDDPDRSELLLKPLEETAGGYFHVGATLYGNGDVFATPTDPDYQVLAQWVAGASEVATCQEPGSNL